ncbi:unnamed protein product [Didymodactylos carnosus]|nr:unnamed protein product [Didymodactylos carnosus]CAF4371183.1 unnamed protein product [Didymodactylos carnosus]
MLTNPWSPPNNYKFSTLNIYGVARSVCSHSWLSTYPWLSYSHVHGEVFCRYCVLFNRKHAISDRAQNTLGQLVLKPLRSLKDASEFLKRHEKNDYHLLSATQAEYFVKTWSHPETSIDRVLDKEDKDQIITNRKILTNIVKCILFLAKQNLAFRGGDDDGLPDAAKLHLGLGENVCKKCNIYEWSNPEPVNKYL